MTSIRLLLLDKNIISNTLTFMIFWLFLMCSADRRQQVHKLQIFTLTTVIKYIILCPLFITVSVFCSELQIKVESKRSPYLRSAAAPVFFNRNLSFFQLCKFLIIPTVSTASNVNFGLTLNWPALPPEIFNFS